MTDYDQTFFDYVTAGAVRSAERLLPLLQETFGCGSVLDVGCGQGAWLSVWQRLGVADVTGLDGDYVDRQKLLIPDGQFHPADLANPFDLGRRFDLVMSLEVAEHLPAACSDAFVASLVRHGDLVLFSAAPKGQGGHDHINEQDYDYWRRRFAAHGFVAVDWLRPQVLADPAVEPWYRYNPLLYVKAERFDALPEGVRRCRVPDGQAIADLSPWPYRLRKRLVALLPVAVMTRLAKLKERLTAG